MDYLFGEFGQQRGEAAHEEQDQVQQNEGCAAVLADQLWEPPQVAQSHGAADCGHDETDAAVERSPTCHRCDDASGDLKPFGLEPAPRG